MDFIIAFYLLAALQAVLTIGLCWIELRRESAFVLFWAALLLVYVIPSLADPFTAEGAVNPAGIPVRLGGNPVLLRAQVFYLCFCATYLWSRLVVSEAIYAQTDSSLSRRLRGLRLDGINGAVPLGLIVVATLCMLGSVGFRISTLLAGSYTSYRLQAETPLKLASYYFGVAAGGSALLYWINGRRALAITALAGITLIFLAGRTRQVLAASILPFVLYSAFNARGWYARARIVVLGIGLFLLFALLQFFRYAPSLRDGVALLASGALFSDFFVRIAASQGEAALRFAYYYFIEHSDYVGFGHGLTYVRLVMFWLPSSFAAGLKPADFDEVLYSQYYPTDYSAIHGTLHILFPGSAYANLWWFGVLLAAPLAILAAHLNRWLHSTSPEKAGVALGTLSYAAVMLARGSVYNTSMMLFGSLAIIWLAFELARKSAAVAPRAADFERSD